MLSLIDARKIVNKSFPDESIHKVVEYKDLFLFQIFVNRPFETMMDPFYSVDRNTGIFRDFSIIEDGDMGVITELFVAAKPMTKGLSDV